VTTPAKTPVVTAPPRIFSTQKIGATARKRSDILE